MRNAYTILVRQYEGKTLLGDLGAEGSIILKRTLMDECELK
jgi:hypothetical protein